MQVHECFTGQQVLHKESGKPAIIRRLYGSAGEVELAFENGTTAKVHVRLVEPVDVRSDEPRRPCPQCATKLAMTVMVCPECGFEYGAKTAAPPRRFLPTFLYFLVTFAAVYGVWKWVLHGRFPW